MARRLRYSMRSFGGLSANASHRFAANFALQHFDSQAVYSFIPKNGCSTMRYSLAIANGCISGPAQFNWIHRNNATFVASLRDLVTTPYAFTILRCPYARVLSAFLDKIVSRERPFWSFTDAMNDKGAGDGISFRRFVETLMTPGIFRSDPHWRPQVDFLALEDYDDYFQLEDFEHMHSRLAARIGFDVNDARALSGHGSSYQKEVVTNEQASDIPAEELFAMKANGVSIDLNCFYDDVLREKVRKIYKDDFDFRTNVLGDRAISMWS